jgi:hypothetical protein
MCDDTGFKDHAGFAMDPCNHIRAGRSPASLQEDAMDSAALQATEDYSAARATAPRVSLDSMTAKIAFAAFFTIGAAIHCMKEAGPPFDTGLHIEMEPSDGSAPASLDLLTVCIVTMQNGFTVIGKSAPASAENFDAGKGRTFAYEDAIRQLWPLEGYALREQLFVAAELAGLTSQQA